MVLIRLTVLSVSGASHGVSTGLCWCELGNTQIHAQSHPSLSAATLLTYLCIPMTTPLMALLSKHEGG